MICENLVTTGTINEIFGNISPSCMEYSLMINTPYGFITVPVKNKQGYKINQIVEVSIQITSNEKNSTVS